MLAATGLALAITWISIVLAYDSFEWSSSGNSWPVSFFVVALVLIVYLLSAVPGLIGSRRVGRRPRVDRQQSGLAAR
jgi:zinc/manganese transport system permease protein